MQFVRLRNVKAIASKSRAMKATVSSMKDWTSLYMTSTEFRSKQSPRFWSSPKVAQIRRALIIVRLWSARDQGDAQTVGTSRLSCGKAVKREYSRQFGSHPGNPGLNVKDLLANYDRFSSASVIKAVHG
jgi:hypothetical protein